MHAHRVRSSALRTIPLTALVCVATLSCASARQVNDTDAASHGSRDADREHSEIAGTGSARGESAGSAAISSIAGTGSTSSVAGSSATDCRGPGIYGYGKGNLRKPCCAGYHQYFFSSPGYDGTNHKSCFDGPDGGTYACLAGECGDGLCEDAESKACGCVDDCPSAAWEGP